MDVDVETDDGDEGEAEAETECLTSRAPSRAAVTEMSCGPRFDRDVLRPARCVALRREHAWDRRVGRARRGEVVVE